MNARPVIRWSLKRQRLELRFARVPTTETRAELKRRGFWWDPGAGVWNLSAPVSLRFVRSEPMHVDGWAYALDLCARMGLGADQAAALTRAHDFAAIQAAENGTAVAAPHCLMICAAAEAHR